MSILGWGSEPTPSARDLCETPKLISDYENLAARTLNECKQLAESTEGWTIIKHGLTPDVKLLDKSQPGNTVNIIKTEGHVDCSPEELFRLVSTSNLKQRQNWEKDLKEYQILEDITENIQVIYQQYNAPFPVQNRDFVAMKVAIKLSDSSWTVFGTTINYDAKPPIDTCVRAVGTSALFIKAIEGEKYKCNTIRIARLDPMGMIPKFVINMGKKKAVQSILAMRDYVNNYVVPKRKMEPERPLSLIDFEHKPKSATTTTTTISTTPMTRSSVVVIDSDTDGDSESEEFFDIEPSAENLNLQYLAHETAVREQLQNIHQLIDQLNKSVEDVSRRIDNCLKEESSFQISFLATTILLGSSVASTGYYLWKKWKK
eukprot:TRINITY_DN4425_c0_g1_i2.p1 TRINITY_DN4425_c0_g1~~TRINITY_DN4425_c0_g1_i2.p1  ORF type:complete len:373 (-),score=62.93 TRINITY_DN4425_c0_g1_i2:113-1231(-)